ncbi:MAG: hypothetical protein ACSHX8_15640 [Opitutaceae bacterium]
MIEIITSEEKEKILRTPYNPAVEYNDDYESEHQKIHDLIKEKLFEFVGGNGWLGWVERFSMNDDMWTESRFVSVCLAEEECFQPGLIKTLQKIVSELPVDYILHVWHETESFGEFELLFTNESIRGYFVESEDYENLIQNQAGDDNSE